MSSETTPKKSKSKPKPKLNVLQKQQVVVRGERGWDVKVGPIKQHKFDSIMLSSNNNNDKTGNSKSSSSSSLKSRRIVFQIVQTAAATAQRDDDGEGEDDKHDENLDTTENNVDDIMDRLLLSSKTAKNKRPLLNPNDEVIIKIMRPKRRMRHWGFATTAIRPNNNTSSPRSSARSPPRFRRPRLFRGRQQQAPQTAPPSNDDISEEQDSSSSSSRSSSSIILDVDEEAATTNTKTTTTTSSHPDFVEFRQYSLDEIYNLKVINNSSGASGSSTNTEDCVLEISFGKQRLGMWDTTVQDVTFESRQQRQEFVTLLEVLRQLTTRIESLSARCEKSDLSNKNTNMFERQMEELLAKAFVMDNNNRKKPGTTTTTTKPPSVPTPPSYIMNDMPSSRPSSSKREGGGDVEERAEEEKEEKEEKEEGRDENDDAATMIDLLIEIVSATDLPNVDDARDGKSDPFVKVWLDDTEIHRTSVIQNRHDPIWTVETGSLFYLRIPSLKEFFGDSSTKQEEGLLTFEVFDYDYYERKSYSLGKVVLNHHELFELAKNDSSGNHNDDGQQQQQQPRRQEFQLMQLWPGFDVTQAVFPPRLNLRIKFATQQDFQFLKILHKLYSSRKKKKKRLGISNNNIWGVYSDSAYVKPRHHKYNYIHRETKQTKNGTVLHKVKPFPDPDRPSEQQRSNTQWMTSEDIQDACYRPSKDWIETGSGEIGYVYLEILKCDDLPDLDSDPVNKGNVTDAFCGVVYEDAIVYTDVIYDELSPRWMPWTQRAFVFRMQHLSTQLMIGVFDYNQFTSPNTVGRVSINLINFDSDTEYVLTYALYDSVFPPMDDDDGDDYHDGGGSKKSFLESPSTKRIPRGTITIRLRIILADLRSAVLSSIKPPPFHYVNAPNLSDFRMARYITYGDENLCVVSFQAVSSYQNELEEYVCIALHHIQQALKTVMLWRGHYTIFGGGGDGDACHRHHHHHHRDGSDEEENKKCCGCSCRRYNKPIKLPLHSAVAFSWGIFLVEDYNLIPSFALFCISWFFLATNERRQNHPDPWRRCPEFLEIWKALILNRGQKGDNNVSTTEEHDDFAGPDELTSLLATTAHDTEEMKLQKFRKKFRDALDNKGTASEILFAEHEKQNEEDETGIETNGTYATTKQSYLETILLKGYVLPIQRLLGNTCITCRIVTNLVNWNESIYAFFITNVCLIGSLLFLFIPWGWIIRWLLRIGVWVFLGPWMKLVDIFIIRKLEGDDDNMLKRLDAILWRIDLFKMKRAIMISRENAQKLLAMKQYMFGYYMVRVPSENEARYTDIPISMSSTRERLRHEPKEDDQHSVGVNVVVQKHGQSLVGDMVPTWGDKGDDAILSANAFKTKHKMLGLKKKLIPVEG